jgi:hypothetical protein
MENHEYVVSILSNLDLDNIEEHISEPYHKTGPVRPLRKPALRVDWLDKVRSVYSSWCRG